MLYNKMIQKLINIYSFLNHPTTKALVLIVAFAFDFSTGGSPPGS